MGNTQKYLFANMDLKYSNTRTKLSLLIMISAMIQLFFRI